MSAPEIRPPLPPFTEETAKKKVRGAEDAWNTRDPEVCARVYTEDTRWRNRAEFPLGREAVKAFSRRKWAKELDYRLIKELWAHTGPVIAVRFASINDLPIAQGDRKFFWPLGRRPDEHPGLSELGL
jgi:nuclear transport factor 2 (NTF2) superfamily protein